ncbi:LamG domain-containing protein, partial [Candidatus Saccharibacteria bacterium]|nr:LamG domain-containing protein [Candidatus Saccharibacteria bacterium]
NVSSFDTDWHHVAVTYDGSIARMYIDGVLDASAGKAISVATSNKQLLIGLGYGGREYGKPEARLNGQLDELRLSTIARTEFTTTPYANQPQTISLAANARPSGVQQWDTLSDTQLAGGGTVTYRLSNDGGVSWLYWDGADWSVSSDLAQANTTAVVTANFAALPINFNGLRWQAIMSGNGFEQVALDGVSAEATSDTTQPSVNPTTISAYTSNGGSQFNAGEWTNGASPYFTWDNGVDAGSGVYGYCVYLGSDNSADPTTTKGILGVSPVDGGGHCPFVVAANELDLAVAGMLGSPLVSDTNSYYLILRTIDRAGNTTASSTQFDFRFDNTEPNNPGFITAPSGYINTKDVEMTWEVSGGSAATDDHSGVIGLQYRIGPSGTW